jgi:hypothetical protein
VSHSPYEPPATRRDARPAVILWFRVYAAVMAIAYLGIAAFGVAAQSSVVVGVGAVLAVLHAFAAFVPFKPWGWTVAIVAIAFGAASVAVFFAIPLLVHWIRPTTKAAFARL